MLNNALLELDNIFSVYEVQIQRSCLGSLREAQYETR
jgi:hypothetical protein